MKRALTRSEQMARIGSTRTKPELLLRSALWHAGLRYRLRPVGRYRPDIVLVSRRVVVYVDGCFWHGCPDHYVPPRTRTAYWAEKLAGNVARDLRQTEELTQAGWFVIRLWEHEVERSPEAAAARILRTIELREIPETDWRVQRIVGLSDGEREELHLVALRDSAQPKRIMRFRSFLMRGADLEAGDCRNR